ncbi:ABC transporter substrate-binding protein [uncultured Anaerococcus sp.]|uniref:ABC transporter substrate-binding protein n=1 Tax=uncultured Anaerococcus sp. TaxID=293428 RepID=UPI002632C650|nr:ABC transporter substrate-binding protein [uncultured Anaerococcus sp.]
MKNKLRNFSLMAILLLILTACGSGEKKATDDTKSSKQVAETSKNVDGKIEIEDVLGRKITLDKPMEKVIIQGSGSGGPFMTMMYLDKDNFYKKIGGMDDGIRKHRNDLYKRLVEKIPELENVKRVSNFSDNDFSVEELLAIDADGIIAPVSYKAQLDSIEDKLGIPILYVDYHNQEFDDHLKSTEIIAKATGLDKNLDKLNGFYKEKIDNMKDRIKDVKTKPNVFLEHGYEGEHALGNSYGNKMMWGKIICDAGGHNLAGDILGEKEATPVSEEFVLSSNPDMIFITGAEWVEKPESMKMGFGINPKDVSAKIEKYKSRNGWADLKAMKDKKVYVIGQNLARDMSDFYAYEALAKAFHPDLFRDVDPDADMKEFYQNFMPIEYQGCWFTKYE